MNTYAPDYAKDEEATRCKVAESECVVVASVLTYPHERPVPPAVCSVIAFHEYFESVEAHLVAEAILKAQNKGWRPTRLNVGRLLTEELRGWMRHPTFSENNALPLSCAESEAMWLLPRYRNKRLIAVVARMHGMMIERPDKAQQLALDLRLQLEDLT